MSSAWSVRIENVTRQTPLCVSATVADTFRTRLVGLLGHGSLKDGGGLLLLPSQGIHTVGMRFPIDVVFLSQDLAVLRIRAEVRPWRMRLACKGTHSVLELPSGRARQACLAVGDRLSLQQATPVAG